MKGCHSPTWELDAKGKLRRLDTNNRLEKLNADHCALTGRSQQQPVYAMKLSKKRNRLNYKQYKSQLCVKGSQMLNNMNVGTQCPTMSDLMGSPTPSLSLLLQMILDPMVLPRN